MRANGKNIGQIVNQSPRCGERLAGKASSCPRFLTNSYLLPQDAGSTLPASPLDTP